jgi:hypothetical protein
MHLVRHPARLQPLRKEAPQPGSAPGRRQEHDHCGQPRLPPGQLQHHGHFQNAGMVIQGVLYSGQ